MILLAVVSRTAVSTAAGDGPAVRVRTVLLDVASGALYADEHFRVRACAQNPLSAFGDVLVEPGKGAWQADRLAASCPGALVVAVHHGPRCWIRSGPSGRVLEVEVGGPGQPEGFWETVASLAHSCLVAGLPASALGSAAVCVLGTHASSGPSCSNRRSRCRAASASSDRDRPTDE